MHKLEKIIFLLLFSLWLLAAPAVSAQQLVQFRLKLPESKPDLTVGVRGNLPPLSWKQSLALSDPDGDGIYTATLAISPSSEGKLLEYKFLRGEEWELKDLENRAVYLEEKTELPLAVWDEPGPVLPEKIITAAQLQEEFTLVKKAYTQLHPGLYRYQDSLAMEAHFAALKQELSGDLPQRELYLIYSRFLARIRCGHSYTNFWNQSTPINQWLFDQPDKLPFFFRLPERRMIITASVTADERFRKGTEILSINGHTVAEIIEGLLPYIKGDGNNLGQRLAGLELHGMAKYEAFDAFFPLLFPPLDGGYTLEARTAEGQVFSAKVAGLSRRERSRKAQIPVESWSFRLLDEETAYLQLNTFVTWTMEFDWKKFLADAFQQIATQRIPHLIIDIRGNEGGSDEVILELGRYLVSRPLVVREQYQSLSRYLRTPDELNPYLSTWDNSIRDLRGQWAPAGKGFFREKNTGPGGFTVRPARYAFSGKANLLIDASNSSATFILADIAQRYGLATLVGQPTGGNRRGITGGRLFFLNLPHSGIEMDIPLIGQFPLQPQPDEGVMPDISVELSAEDLIQGRDPVLERAMEKE